MRPAGGLLVVTWGLTVAFGVPLSAHVQTEVPPAVPGAKPATVERVKIHGTALEGQQYITSALVSNFAAQVTVRRTTAESCSTGAGASHAQALLKGAFFNGGGGTASDDVQAFLQFDRYSSDPPGVARVGGFLGYQGGFFSNVDLGPVNVGELVRVELAWDQPNHRFITRLFKPASNTLVEQYMPYTVSDSMPAVAPLKSLSASTAPANCLGQRTSTEMEVLFDNVMTN